jgi:diacylglycerol kinase
MRGFPTGLWRCVTKERAMNYNTLHFVASVLLKNAITLPFLDCILLAISCLKCVSLHGLPAQM